MKKIIKAVPILGAFAQKVYRKLISRNIAFPGSKNYWEQRYKKGGNSGAGSYNKLAIFKAKILNDFVKNNCIETVIEFGCGDGNQLKLAKYPSYLGFDVSNHAIVLCEKVFKDDNTKRFMLLNQKSSEMAQLTISLDVVYHLIEDDVFFRHMENLFDSSSRFVIIYSSNCDDDKYVRAPHVKHRNFHKWVLENKRQWELVQHIPNIYPYIKDDNENGSFADFYIYKKLA